jgi:diguanylate cyclase (GGDEF)-like protein
MNKPLRVLFVEDNPGDAALLVRELRKGGFEPLFERVDTRAAMAAALERQMWDAVFADHSMPHFSALEALKVMKEHNRDMPFIIVSGTMSEDKVVNALKAGAHDYIVKGRFMRLVPALERELQDAQMRREREEAERARRDGQAKIEHMASHDALTDLPNRTLFHEHLQQALKWRRRQGSMLAVHFLDLDDFKHVNDTLGHPVGDKVLQMVAKRLRACLRTSDIVARLSGDEFGIVQVEMLRPEEAAGLARKVCKILGQPMHIGTHEIRVSGSVGVTLYPSDAATIDQLLQNADMALYQAKKDGRNTFCFFTVELNARMQQRVALEQDLRRALDNGELVLHYQPQIDLESGKIIGVEALVRWQHPTRGLLAPGEFISIAEDSGLIVRLTSWVLNQACRQQRIWQEAGCEPCRIAVNVSPSHLQREDLAAMVEVALNDSGMESECLEIEVTEALLLGDMAKVLRTLNHLHTLGVSIALDDFGTGYSSLSYLRQLPVDRLKIDRSFVSRVNGHPRENSVIDAIIGLGHNLDMRVIGEGVENVRQAAYLRDQGCDEGQGYYFQRPVVAEQLTASLQKKAASAGLALSLRDGLTIRPTSMSGL